jgi:hypothetical protein
MKEIRKRVEEKTLKRKKDEGNYKGRKRVEENTLLKKKD